MMLTRKSVVGSLVLTLLVSACAINSGGDKEAMLILSSKLTKLSAAVESTVRYKNPPADLDEQSLLLLSTQHDAQLLEIEFWLFSKLICTYKHTLEEISYLLFRCSYRIHIYTIFSIVCTKFDNILFTSENIHYLKLIKQSCKSSK